MSEPPPIVTPPWRASGGGSKGSRSASRRLRTARRRDFRTSTRPPRPCRAGTLSGSWRRPRHDATSSARRGRPRRRACRPTPSAPEDPPGSWRSDPTATAPRCNSRHRAGPRCTAARQPASGGRSRRWRTTPCSRLRRSRRVTPRLGSARTSWISRSPPPTAGRRSATRESRWRGGGSEPPSPGLSRAPRWPAERLTAWSSCGDGTFRNASGGSHRSPRSPTPYPWWPTAPCGGWRTATSKGTGFRGHDHRTGQRKPVPFEVAVRHPPQGAVGYFEGDGFPLARPVVVAAGDSLRYLRAGLLGTVNAANGDTRLYLAPGADSLAAAWAKLLAPLIRPLDSLPRALRAQLPFPVRAFRAATALVERWRTETAAWSAQPREPFEIVAPSADGATDAPRVWMGQAFEAGSTFAALVAATMARDGPRVFVWR